MNAEKLNRLKRWRDYWKEAANRKDLAYLLILYPTLEAFAWHLRTEREALIAAGALVKTPSRDVLIDTVEHPRFVARQIKGATERATTTS